MPPSGGGLDPSPGIFAVRPDHPFYILEHGHNLFLDVSFEQGILAGWR
jgi:hypothetical protein